MGRKLRYATEEERQAARKTSKAKSMSVTLTTDLVNDLKQLATEMEAQLGFRPTYSQVIRHIFRHTKSIQRNDH
jgi:hypothetical protein